MTQEIEEKRQLIQYMEQYTKTIEMARYNCNNICISKIPGRYILRGESIAKDLTEWIKWMSYTEYGHRYTFNGNVLSEESAVMEGVWIAYQSIVERYGLTPTEADTYKSVQTTQDIYGHLFDSVQKTIASDLDRLRMG